MTSDAKKLALIEQMREAREADERQLATTTWLLKRMRQMKSALQECETYFEERADAEIDSAGTHGNCEMQLLVEVRQALGNLRQSVTFATAEDGAVIARIFDEDAEKSA